MPEMESLSKHSGRSNSTGKRRSGYEPSDTENDWQESPWHDLKTPRHNVPNAERTQTPVRTISPLYRNQRYSTNPNYDVSPPNRSSSPKSYNVTRPNRTSRTSTPRSISDVTPHNRSSRTSPVRRKNSRSPYKPRRDNDGVDVLPIPSGSDPQKNISPFSKNEQRVHVSPYKTRREVRVVGDDVKEEPLRSTRKQSHRTPPKRLNPEEDRTQSQLSERSNYSHRSASAPKPRAKERDLQTVLAPIARRAERTPSPLSRSQIRSRRREGSSTASEINEMVANVKLGKNSKADMFKSTESISPGSIFFSRECTTLVSQKKVATKNNGFHNSSFPPRPISNQQVDGRAIVSSRSSSTLSRHSSGKSSTESSKMGDGSVLSGQSLSKFTANRHKSNKDTWLGCMRKGPCRTSKSPDHGEFDEASFIEKAFVVEKMREFWADKYKPGSLSGFTCHKHQAQLLKSLISHDSCPNILFNGPPGSGKKALTMALLRDIYGDPAWDISHELRCFQIIERGQMQVVIPVTSSAHHVELNLKLEPNNARYVLMTIVKELTRDHRLTPDVSVASMGTDYKVIVLHEADKLSDSTQHMIKWITDCYTDACKIILCCEDDANILDSVKSRCKVITVDAPVTHEIMEVLIQIARCENFDLPMSFAAKLATKSKQNLRKAIMALEACKAHNYPFVDEQPIPFGWEDVLEELAAEVLADPSPKRLFFIRGKFQKLLVDFVHPKLILQKLVEQFLKGIEASLKRELYYWHAYYDKRLPLGTSALLKLEGKIGSLLRSLVTSTDLRFSLKRGSLGRQSRSGKKFVAKFMSIYRKGFRGQHYPQ
ncbi:hypothetical protein GIB67_002640 [Kingdonia uniflora]|uniref:Replication factor C subunit 3 n=1 Tax=Kingdonia uniflora TaxID=39325 RepID=A0A7J7N4B2_9MAGN|nr:hypothetical protein GIB67_002640 [Kingdonia uniflora]